MSFAKAVALFITACLVMIGVGELSKERGALVRPEVDFNRPVFTRSGAILCPVSLISDDRPGYGFQAAVEMFDSHFGREERAAKLGCWSVEPGIRVIGRRLTVRGMAWVRVPIIGTDLFTFQSELRN